MSFDMSNIFTVKTVGTMKNNKIFSTYVQSPTIKIKNKQTSNINSSLNSRIHYTSRFFKSIHSFECMFKHK